MTNEAVVSRRAWLLGLAGKAAGRVVEAVEDRIPEQLMPAALPADDELGTVSSGACDLGAKGAPHEPAEGDGSADLPPPTLLTLHRHRCIAIIGIDCGACARLCPDDVRGLWLVRGRPVIDPVACVGCGACTEGCPTSPSALELRVVAPVGDEAMATALQGSQPADAAAVTVTAMTTDTEDETPGAPDFSAVS